MADATVPPLLSQSIGEQVASQLKQMGVSSAVIDLNTRVTIPASTYAQQPVDLWATVIRPRATGKRPTILVAIPYRREIMGAFDLPLVSHDFNLMLVDLRGTGSSGGEFQILDFPQHYDIAYVIDQWIPSQAWSDGQVGMIGGSYLGIIQLLAGGQVQCDPATQKPLHLKAIFPQVPMSDAYQDTFCPGGTQNLFYDIWLKAIDLLGMFPPLLLFGESLPPHRDDILEAARIWNSHYQGIALHDAMLHNLGFTLDGQLYDEKSPMIYWPDKPEGGWNLGQEGVKTLSPQLPVFLLGGWFDVFTRGTLDEYEHGLKNHQPGDKALIMGQWYHLDVCTGLGIPWLMRMDLPARWFNWKMGRQDDGFMQDFPVLLEVMGENRWRGEKAWPLPSSRVTDKIFHLSKVPAQAIQSDWFTNNPSQQQKNYLLTDQINAADLHGMNPMLRHSPLNLHGNLLTTRSSVRFSAGFISWPSQISKLLLGKDIDATMPFEDERGDDLGALTFTTDVLAQDTELIGTPRLRFWAATEFDALAETVLTQAMTQIKTLLGVEADRYLDSMQNKDVYWVVDLDDVFPDGRARNITSGYLSAWHRPYNPHTPQGIEKQGHRVHPLDPEYDPSDPFYDHPDREISPIHAGDFYQYEVKLWPTCNVFKRGHRIRISISNSDFPHLLPILIPSKSVIIIDDEFPATLHVQQTNSLEEGVTWKWIDDDLTTYLMTHRDTGTMPAEQHDDTPPPVAHTGDPNAADNSASGLCFIRACAAMDTRFPMRVQRKITKHAPAAQPIQTSGDKRQT